MKCIHLGEKSGSSVTACCGGTTEELTDMYLCNSPKQSADYCVLNKGSKGLAVIRVDGQKDQTVTVAVCVACPFREQLATPQALAIVGEIVPKGRARLAWEALREKRNPPSNVRHVGVLDCDQHGYGDAVMAAWIAEGSKYSSPTLRLKASGQKKALLEMLGQDVLDIAPSTSHGSEYLLGTPGVGSPPSVVSRALKLGIPSAPRRPTAKIPDDALGSARSSDVLIFPQCHQVSRTWPPCNYRELYQLLLARGLTAHLIGIPDPVWNTVDGWVAGLSWVEIAAWMAKTKVVVGNDSGPAHLAGTLNIPTVAIMGRTTEVVFAHCASVKCMATEKREVPCSGCWSGYGYKESVCERGCAAISNITPTDVVEAVVGSIR